MGMLGLMARCTGIRTIITKPAIGQMPVPCARASTRGSLGEGEEILRYETV